VQRWKEKDNLNLLMKCKDGKKKNRVVRGGGREWMVISKLDQKSYFVILLYKL
jgi:hypothetical protein